MNRRVALVAVLLLLPTLSAVAFNQLPVQPTVNLSSTYYTAGQTATATIDFTPDAGTPAATAHTVTLVITGPSSAAPTNAVTCTSPSGGETDDLTSTCTLLIDRADARGDWDLTSLTIDDGDGSPYTVTAVLGTFDVRAPELDSSNPTAVVPLVTAGPVYLAPGQDYDFTVEFNHDTSHTAPSLGYFGTFKVVRPGPTTEETIRVPGAGTTSVTTAADATDGSFTATHTLRADAPQGAWRVSTITLEDANGFQYAFTEGTHFEADFIVGPPQISATVAPLVKPAKTFAAADGTLSLQAQFHGDVDGSYTTTFYVEKAGTPCGASPTFTGCEVVVAPAVAAGPASDGAGDAATAVGTLNIDRDVLAGDWSIDGVKIDGPAGSACAAGCVFAPGASSPFFSSAFTVGPPQPPNVPFITFDGRTLERQDLVTIRVEFTEPGATAAQGSGHDYDVDLKIVDPAGAVTSAHYDAISGYANHDFQVPPGAKAGVWRLDEVVLTKNGASSPKYTFKHATDFEGRFTVETPTDCGTPPATGLIDNNAVAPDMTGADDDDPYIDRLWVLAPVVERPTGAGKHIVPVCLRLQDASPLKDLSIRADLGGVKLTSAFGVTRTGTQAGPNDAFSAAGTDLLAFFEIEAGTTAGTWSVDQILAKDTLGNDVDLTASDWTGTAEFEVVVPTSPNPRTDDELEIISVTLPRGVVQAGDPEHGKLPVWISIRDDDAPRRIDVEITDTASPPNTVATLSWTGLLRPPLLTHVLWVDIPATMPAGEYRIGNIQVWDLFDDAASPTGFSDEFTAGLRFEVRAPADFDSDGVGDDKSGNGIIGDANDDNCRYVSNSSQRDNDSNKIGDVCETDTDGDGVPDAQDLCDTVADASNDDNDGDAIGDACDLHPFDGPGAHLDTDGDGVQEPDDLCPGFDDTVDSDGDGVPDGCDSNNANGPNADDDGDGVPNKNDRCPGHDDKLDLDGDGTANGCDGNNNDGPLGDLDRDGVLNRHDRCPGHDDNGRDEDGDGLPDACDRNLLDGPLADQDGDGVINKDDNCRLTSNVSQANLDGDSLGDACDNDVDGDSVDDDVEVKRGTDPRDGDDFPAILAGPSRLTVTQTADGAKLEWTPVDGATQYAVWRQASPWARLGVVTGTTYEDRSVPDGAQVTYRVVAVDEDGIGNAREIRFLDGFEALSGVRFKAAPEAPTPTSETETTGDEQEGEMAEVPGPSAAAGLLVLGLAALAGRLQISRRK